MGLGCIFFSVHALLWSMHDPQQCASGVLPVGVSKAALEKNVGRCVQSSAAQETAGNGASGEIVKRYCQNSTTTHPWIVVDVGVDEN